MEKYDIVIIGAGVLGLSLCYHLSKKNKKVLLLEQEVRSGVHASGKNAGMFRHLNNNHQLTNWAEKSQKLWPRELAEVVSINGSFIKSENITQDRKDLFEKKTIMLFDKKEEFIYTRNDGTLNSLKYLEVLTALIDKENCHINFQEKVSNFNKIQNNWIIETVSEKQFETELLVIANGAWFDNFKFTEQQILQTEKKVFARHVFRLRLKDESYMPQANCGYFWDEEAKWYMRKEDGDKRLFSICDRELVNDIDNYKTNHALKDLVHTKIEEYLPEILSLYEIIDYWHCFRTFTKDELPICGWDPYHSNLFWLAAFGGFGMSTSFAAAYDSADIISGQKQNPHVEFLASRFSQ